MNNEIKAMPLEEELKSLLSNYKSNEIDYFKEIVDDVERYRSEIVINCNVFTKESGSNG